MSSNLYKNCNKEHTGQFHNHIFQKVYGFELPETLRNSYYPKLYSFVCQQCLCSPQTISQKYHTKNANHHNRHKLLLPFLFLSV